MSEEKLYGGDEKLGKDKVEGGLNESGSYMGVLGRTYKATSKNMRTRIVTDIFLLNRTNDSGSVNIKLMECKTVGGEVTLEYLKEASGKPRVWGTIFRHSNPDGMSTDAETTKNLFAANRKKFAKALGAFDEDTSTVDWDRIQALAGKFVSFNLVERNGYLNIDLKTLQLHDVPGVKPSVLKARYSEFEAAQMAQQTSDLPGGMPSAPPPDAAPPKKDDLPF